MNTAMPAAPAQPNRKIMRMMLKMMEQILHTTDEVIYGYLIILSRSTCMILISWLLLTRLLEHRQTFRLFLRTALLRILYIFCPTICSFVSAQTLRKGLINLVMSSAATSSILLSESYWRLWMLRKMWQANSGTRMVAWQQSRWTAVAQMRYSLSRIWYF